MSCWTAGHVGLEDRDDAQMGVVIAVLGMISVMVRFNRGLSAEHRCVF